MRFRPEADGWVRSARRIPSPNCDQRPAGLPVQLLVVHCISLPRGEYGGNAVIDLFTNRLDPDSHAGFAGLHGLRVSSHFLIRRDGALLQFVSCRARAWHAGVSRWRGRADCNDFSIGVELEGVDDAPFEDAQYETLLALQAGLSSRYPLRAQTGHQDIAPGRKTDPGSGFDWSRVAQGLPRSRG